MVVLATQGGVLILSCRWQFLVTQAEDRDTLVPQVDGVMQALLDLEEVDERLSDSGVSLDLGEMRVVIEVVVAGDDYQECVGNALGAIRTAIHAAGGATPEWTSDVITRAHFEPQDFIAVPA